jgi:hypothetical protein
MRTPAEKCIAGERIVGTGILRLNYDNSREANRVKTISTKELVRLVKSLATSEEVIDVN